MTRQFSTVAASHPPGSRQTQNTPHKDTGMAVLSEFVSLMRSGLTLLHRNEREVSSALDLSDGERVKLRSLLQTGLAALDSKMEERAALRAAAGVVLSGSGSQQPWLVVANQVDEERDALRAAAGVVKSR